MGTIFDTYVSLNQLEYLEADIESNPDSFFGRVATVSGITLAEQMVAILWYLGYKDNELAEFRNTTPKDIRKEKKQFLQKINDNNIQKL